MIRYLTGDEINENIVVNGETIFYKGCFNCSFLEKRKSAVSGTCPYCRADVWKDWTCEHHNPINKIEPKD